MEQYVILVAVLATTRTGSRDFGLCVRDSMGEIPCEVSFKYYTVEPLKKGHFGANSFVPCREVVPISEVNNTLK